ncbi:phosphoribosylglycinamide formyltransferase [Anaerosphaera multitolerans]|uniref:Phosphoribosylglycinamide formyltransferase n=1 Tax=Anaerosphaera multitolerans TaxID=2487351 RepID=A0A437S4N5_9FIRM|nr:phosphoribosylglycinamide formyltransferase [Anaerosphaera multitolerans]RVU53992.1 phosphoribosylglycinamide formyltransferase [Anaerosphaera multitolerans]
MKIAVLISGTGSNLKALLEAQKQKEFESEIVLIVSNRKAKGLEYGKEYGIPAVIIKEDEELLRTLGEYGVDFIVLAGYLKTISSKILESYKDRIINIHPSLLPKYGGKGFYGIRVHEAVFKNKDETSGVTVHYVNEEVDGGEIILQETLNISHCKNPEEIAECVLKLEHSTLKRAIKKIEEEK